MLIYLDIETIPDQAPGALNKIMEAIEVKAPSLLKPKLIDALGLCQKADKFKSVDELKELWLDKFTETEKTMQAESKWLKTSFDGSYGAICCICLAFDDGRIIKLTGAEKEILNCLNGIIEYDNPHKSIVPTPYFIGHNIKGFDLPFLYKRFVINSIKPSFKIILDGRHGKDFFCTMQGWAGYGKTISMDNLANILGIKGKTDGMDGSQVWPEFQKGNINKIANYCADDVECTREIYKRITFK